MHMRKILTWLYTVLLVHSGGLFAQSTRPVEGLSDERDPLFVFTNVTLVQEPGKILKGARVHVQGGEILRVGGDGPIPASAIVYDLKGRYMVPSFIELISDYGQPEVKPAVRERRASRGAQAQSNLPGPLYWNQAVHPEAEGFAQFEADAKKAAEWRKAGFGAALTLQRDGIVRGSAALVLMGDESTEESILKGRAAQGMSFNKGSSTQDYPSSLMGSIALIRQAIFDAQWYAGAKEKEYNASLEAWNRNGQLAVVFEVSDHRSALRAARIAAEAGTRYVIKGTGDEYKRIEEISRTGSSFIVPLNFPKAYDMANPFDALNVSLAELKHWESAPANPAILEKAGVRFAFTSDGLKEKKELMPAIQKSLKFGLSRDQALAALTTIPAALVGAGDKLGALRPGMLANFLICTHDVFDKENVLLEHWVAGKRHILMASDSVDMRGNYRLKLDTLTGWNLSVSGSAVSPEFTFQKDSLTRKADASRSGSQWTFRFEPVKGKSVYRMNASFEVMDRSWSGWARSADGDWLSWSATRTGDAPLKADSLVRDSIRPVPETWYPNTAYGWESTTPLNSKPSSFCIRNATVWTCEDAGVLTSADVLVRDGKIAMVGKCSESDWKGLEVIDGTGMHLTPGLIDEHSHIAINEGVNEGTQSITSEVRIGDVIYPDDINIYRQLAGGVTTSHLLHGSANAIGGQTAVIKLRWGKGSEQMKFEGADPFIKFALGENVKQTNWGDNNVTRYPQTRMGVEQIYIDAFTRAREYDNAWKSFNTSKLKMETPRRDLELDALAEILNSKRFITCHSYQQGEINMLMHVADSFGFRVNTFTHILEGYKVADKMKKHGAGGSSFADWWAYKYEVIEAIPHNGAIMHRCGILTAFNSDDAEMARRLNQEAAKAVKYGNVSEEEALKFVTLNPAKLLHVDNRVGSIKAGKDADLVLWNGPPLSIYAKPLKTYIEGVAYFDAQRDLRLRERDEKERMRIQKKMVDEKNSGAPTQKPVTLLHEEYHCNDMESLPY